MVFLLSIFEIVLLADFFLSGLSLAESRLLERLLGERARASIPIELWLL